MTDIVQKSDKLPEGITLEEDGDLLWVVYGGRRRMSVPSREEGLKQAWLMVAFEVREETDRWRKEWPPMGAFEFIDPPAPAPDPLPRPIKFMLYFEWTSRWPIFRAMIRADYASWLIWRQVRGSVIEDTVRQTNPVLVWCFYYLTIGAGSYYRNGHVAPHTATAKYDPGLDADVIYVGLGTLLSARRRLRELIAHIELNGR